VEDDKLLARVRAMVERAEHPDTPPEEADTARRMADALMHKHAIDRAMLNQKSPKAEQEKPDAITLRLCDAGNPLLVQFSMLSVSVARHTRCEVVLLPSHDFSPTRIRVFGFKSDLDYFQILYTTILMHMSGIFFPKPEDDMSLEENLLRLRSLGLNWLQMAEVYGWRKTGRKIDGDKIEYMNAKGEKKTNWQLGSFYKRTTHRAARSAGVELKIIQAGTSRKQAGDDWRRSAAEGYVTQIDIRFEMARGKREPGTDLVLASSFNAIRALRDAEFQHLGPVDGDKFRLSLDAYSHGKNHANSADISGAARVAGKERTAIQ
jgi:hypothetical protein